MGKGGGVDFQYRDVSWSHGGNQRDGKHSGKFPIDIPMNLTSALLATLAVVAPLQAAVTFTAGTWLQLNFTNSAPASSDHFNNFATVNNSLNATTGNTFSMIDSLGNVYGTVGNPLTLTASGWNAAGTNGGTWVSNSAATPATGTSTWSTEEYQTFWWDNSGGATARITGLDPTKQYNIYYYSKLNSTSSTESHRLTINGTFQDTGTRAARWSDVDQDLLFTNISPNGANGDELNFTWSDVSGNNPFVSAIIIQVVPEPSVVLLGGLGVLSLLRRRR